MKKPFCFKKYLVNILRSLKSKSIESKKSPYQRVLFDSNGEKEFAEHLENSSKVIVYTKLPRGFKIDTPLGGYTPDWAIVWKTDAGEKLYLVRETKFGYTNLENELRPEEWKKILFVRKHFEVIGFNDFDISQKEDLSDIVKN